MKVDVTIFCVVRCESGCLLLRMAVCSEFSCQELSNQGSIGSNLHRDLTGRIRNESDRTCVCVGYWLTRYTPTKPKVCSVFLVTSFLFFTRSNRMNSRHTKTQNHNTEEKVWSLSTLPMSSQGGRCQCSVVRVNRICR